jgi:cytochrome c oxidase subunit 3
MTGAPITMERAGRDPVGSWVGMTIALGSWAMLFGTLFISYVILRGRQPVWPPAGLAELPRILPMASTLVLLASSGLLQRGMAALGRGDAAAYRRRLLLAILGGLIFPGLQVMLWLRVSASGIHLTTGVFGSVFYLLTWFHAIHIVGGLVALLTLLPGALRGDLPEEAQTRPRLIALFWHFLALMWIAIYLAVFVF